jgi:hypothetical protein
MVFWVNIGDQTLGFDKLALAFDFPESSIIRKNMVEKSKEGHVVDFMVFDK